MDGLAHTAEIASDARDPEIEVPTPLEARLITAQADLAATLRAIQTVSGMAAGILETGGSRDDLGALFTTMGCLNQQAGDRGEILGALLTSAGSA